MELDKIVCMDALDYLRGLEDASVDMVLTDMPYNTTACEWDTALPLEELWVGIKRVRRQGAAIVATASQPFSTILGFSNLSELRYEWIWSKPQGTGYLNANRNPMKSHEQVLVFYDSLDIYNPQMREGTPYSATRGAVGGFVRDKSVGGYTTKNNGERYPLSVLEFNYDKERLHPTQKPVALFEYLIKTYTQPGDVVLDPFMGSGTTALAAKLTGRHYIGCDLSQQYVDIANARLADMPQDKTLQNGDVQLSLFGD